MEEPIVGLTKTLQCAYDEQYTDAMTEWRELGGRYKAENILTVCRDHTFAKVLECGAGEGSILKFLDASGAFSELYAIEVSDSGISQILRRGIPTLREVKKFNGYEIPYPDEAFDMVYCSHVIEHVEHPRLLLRELKRVSRFQVFEVPLDYSIGVDTSTYTHQLCSDSSSSRRDMRFLRDS
jgi:ubiquinone/menaquinone biosynthesis C-methylase UbiE